MNESRLHGDSENIHNKARDKITSSKRPCTVLENAGQRSLTSSYDHHVWLLRK